MNKKTLIFRVFALVAVMMCALGASAAEAYANYTPSNTTLTFYYDNLRSTRTGTTYDLTTAIHPDWYNDGINAEVTQVVFDPSFANARPTSACFWFAGMEFLQSISGLEYLNTSEMTDMQRMFYGCYRLTSLDLSHFNTEKVIDMHAMFASCYSLSSLDVSHFNTANVTDMSYMFYNCMSLTSLDLSSFNTSNVSIIIYMFDSCYSIITIYVGDGWTTAGLSASPAIFNNCENLVGGMGTTYNKNQTFTTYAHIDGGPSNPGYFTALPQAYACYTPDNTTLTFYYDGLRNIRSGTAYDLNEGNDQPGWCVDGSNTSVTRVEFDPSFTDARPTSTAEWFSSMFNLVTIDGLIYLNTSEVTTMKSMFNDCSAVLTADLSGFDTRNVSDMSAMFAFCIAEELDLTSFSTEKVTNMSGMFSFDSSLKTIYVGDEWTTAAVTSSTMMFYGCTSLVGGQGSAYDENHTDAAYAHIDGGPSNPGYFTNGVKFDPVMLPANENYIGLTSFRADWTDETPEANVASYTLLVNPKIDEPVLLSSLYGSWYTGGYADITLPAPWGGVNVRGGQGAIYVKNNYNGNARGYITYTIPEGYVNATFSLSITTGSGSYAAGNYTVYTPQTAAVGHDFVAEETYTWLVTASTGEKITIYSTDSGASADIALMSVSAVGNAEGQLISGITDKFYTVENLEAGGTYQYRVKALYTDGKESAWSNAEEVTLSENTQFLRGDVNGDGRIDVEDVTLLISAVLGNATVNQDVADVNDDTVVDIEDVTTLIARVLTGSW